MIKTVKAAGCALTLVLLVSVFVTPSSAQAIPVSTNVSAENMDTTLALNVDKPLCFSFAKNPIDMPILAQLGCPILTGDDDNRIDLVSYKLKASRIIYSVNGLNTKSRNLLTGAGYEVIEFAGKTRYETAQNIASYRARTSGAPPGYVISGIHQVDATSAGVKAWRENVTLIYSERPVPGYMPVGVLGGIQGATRAETNTLLQGNSCAYRNNAVVVSGQDLKQNSVAAAFAAATGGAIFFGTYNGFCGYGKIFNVKS